MARITNPSLARSVSNGPVTPVRPANPGPNQAVQQKFVTFRSELAATMIEMDDAVDCLLTGLVNGGNVFLMGPPGTGKSFLCEGVCNWVQGNFFNLLLSPTSIPEELFGPVSLKQYRETDVLRRNTVDALPESNISFLDEVMKAPSAVLSALLKIMNERVYHNGPGNHMPVPLRMVVGASNEFAGAGDEAVASFLAPFWDRFLYRTVISGKLTREGRDRLMREPRRKIRPSCLLSLAELDQAQADALLLPVLPETWEAFCRILDELEAGRSITVSPRRLDQLSHGGIQAYAYLSGDDTVRPEHLEVLQWCLWTEGSTEQRNQVRDIVLPIANPTAAKLTEYRQMVAEELEKVKKARSEKKQGMSFTLVASNVTDALRDIDGQVKRLPRSAQTERLHKYIEERLLAVSKAIIDNDFRM